MKTTRKILLAVTGLSPQIVTETLYALASRQVKPWIPDEVHIITTATGAENARLNLLLPEKGWFHRLCKDYNLPSIAFPQQNIHILRDSGKQPMEDIRTQEQNTLAADLITDILRKLTQSPDTELHVSIAGGRKTMGYYLGYALSLYGRPQDKLSHVLVSDPYETNRDFYYPTPYDHPIHVRRGDKETTVDARNAQVELADIPFVRLREGLPASLLKGHASFSQTVLAAQCGARPLELVLDLRQRTATAGGERLKLSPQGFVLLLWMARRRQNGAPPLRCTTKDDNIDAAREYLAVLRELYGEFSPEYERTEKALKNGMNSEWLSPAKKRLRDALVRALGENEAEHYAIQTLGKRADALFQLAIEPAHIKFLEEA